MKKILFVVTSLVALGACKTTKQTKPKPLEETKLEDFISFLDIYKGDTLEKALQIFGPSTENSTYRNISTNFYKDADENTLLQYSYYKNTKRIIGIRVTGEVKTNYATTKSFLKSRGIIDPKVDFLGAKMDSIEKILGKPNMIRGYFYYYHIADTEIALKYSAPEKVCTQIQKYWK